MTTDTSADLLAALHGTEIGMAAIYNVLQQWGLTGKGAVPEGEADFLAKLQAARAAIAAHKEAHRDRHDDACPCYARGWQDGHEAERRH